MILLMVMFTAYGLSETSPLITVCKSTDKPVHGSVGVVVANTEVMVVENGQSQPANTPGELWVRGPQIMKGDHEGKKLSRQQDLQS